MPRSSNLTRRGLIAGASALVASPAWAVKKIIILKRKFNPAQLGAGVLVAWWNADDLADGAVTTWADRIGGVAPTQATGSLQPIKAATSFNSAYAGVTFDGVDDYLNVSSIGAMPTGAASGDVYVVASNTAAAADVTTRTVFAYGGSTTDAARMIRRTSAGTINKANINDQTGNLADDGVAHPWDSGAILNGKFDAGTMYGFINGSAFSNPSAAIAFATGAARTNFGGNAGTPPPGNPWQGVVRHVMAIAGSSSVQDRQRMEGWLAWDCGLTGSLPANHPYKNARP